METMDQNKVVARVRDFKISKYNSWWVGYKTPSGKMGKGKKYSGYIAVNKKDDCTKVLDTKKELIDYCKQYYSI